MALSVDIRKALGNFHLAVQFDAGDETLALLGASGCGKSVTLKCIAGILTPDEGHIELDGVTLYDSASRINLPPQRRQVGYLFQQYALFPNMTVRQNIAAAVRDKARRQTEVAEKLRQFRRWVDDGRMTEEDVRTSYESWKGHMRRGNSWKVLRKTDKLYRKLFGEKGDHQCTKFGRTGA